MAKKKIHGTVLSVINENTVVVDVQRVKIHPRYRKRYKVNKKRREVGLFQPPSYLFNCTNVE